MVIGLSLANPLSFIAAIFTLSFSIGFVAIIAGTGGGVLFTSFLLGFTSIHPDIVRATSLLAAVAGTRIGAQNYLKSIANIRLALFLAAPYTLFAVLGSYFGLYLSKHFGDVGVGALKLSLGLIIICIGVMYVFVKRSEYPKGEGDAITEKLGLELPYYEKSINTVIEYRLRKAPLAFILCCAIGFISGTFGLGAGWAMVPTINLVMLAPLKVATTTSAVVISIGDTAAVFPYMMSGSIIPIFTIPAVSGLMSGARVGSAVAVRIKASYVRYILTFLLLFAGIKLAMVGAWMLGI